VQLEDMVWEYQRGNSKYFNTIYKKTFPFVRAAIYMYVQNKETVEDLIQDTYTKVCRIIDSFTGGNFSSWIYTIAKNTALDYVRKKREILMDDESILPDKDTHPALRYAINHLDPELREVFLMKVLYGHTSKKIADVLGISTSEVNSKYYLAKDTLKKCLESDSSEIR